MFSWGTASNPCSISAHTITIFPLSSSTKLGYCGKLSFSNKPGFDHSENHQPINIMCCNQIVFVNPAGLDWKIFAKQSLHEESLAFKIRVERCTELGKEVDQLIAQFAARAIAPEETITKLFPL